MDPLVFRLRVFVFVLVGVLLLGTVGFVVAEGFSLTDAVYFTVVTVATVGYGDIHPATTTGKMLAIALIVTGVGTFLGVIGNATEIMLNRREKEKRAQKLNMVRGLFFGEIGNKLIEIFAQSDPNIDAVSQRLVVTGEWSRNDFASVSSTLKHYDFKVDPETIDFREVRSLLEGHKGLLLRPLETRVDHWLIYVEHLKRNYPYLFSLAVRTNPFDSEASPVVS